MHIISNSLKKYNELGPDSGTRWVVCEKRRKLQQKVREHFLLVLRRKGNSISSVFQKYHTTMAKRNYHEVLLLFRRVLSPSFSEEGLHCVILVGETPDGEVLSLVVRDAKVPFRTEEYRLCLLVPSECSHVHSEDFYLCYIYYSNLSLCIRDSLPPKAGSIRDIFHYAALYCQLKFLYL